MACCSSSTSTNVINQNFAEPYLTILSNGYMNTPKSCLFRNGSTGYLINCGEGTQRLAMKAHQKGCFINNILITKFDWSCIGGLHAFGKYSDDIASFRNQSKEVTYLHSPVHGHALYDFASSQNRGFSFDKTFNVKQYDYDKNDGIFTKDNFSIRNIRMLENENESGYGLSCFSYIFKVERKLPKLNMEALFKKVNKLFLY